jgi:hypothetical protein
VGCPQHPNANNVTNFTWPGSGKNRKRRVETMCGQCGGTVGSVSETPDPEPEQHTDN